MKIRDCFYLNPPKNSNIHKDYINYIDTSSVTDGKLDEVSYLISDFPSRAQRMVQYGDILYSSVRPNLKHYYYYRDSYSHPIASSGFVLLRNKDTNQCDTEFTYYYLSTKEVVSYLSNIAESSQATFPSFLPKDLGGITLPNVNVKTQKKIASILSAYDSQIENNQRRIKLLEQMAENLYKEWFVRFRFPGYENAEFEGGMPKEWELERLEDFGIVLETGSRPKGGIDSSVETGVPSLGAEAINGLAEFDYNSLKLVPQDYYDKMKRGKSKGNHILVYKDGAYIGKVTIFRNGFPFKEYSINEHVFFLNTKDCDYQNYLYFTLHQKAFFSLMKNLNRNAAQPGLSQQDMNGIKVFKPTKDVVNTFNQYAEPIFNEVFSLAKEIRLLTHQRDLLLPRLMSGKLSI